MPDQPLVQARFDHVDAEGRLVFVAGEEQFAVHVDDTLEHAILEAKQITAEIAPRPAPSQTLPISQIQSLIRAGADPARVAERYGVSAALVRRFSASVETEKQYAIEQFLSVPAPKDSRAHTLSELIDRTFAAARVRPEDVVWKATRRGLEPWRITAQFTSAGRTIRAEWSWNMHDNAVTCLNRTAGKLLGEQGGDRPGQAVAPAADSGYDDGFAVPLNLPGDSARSARIEQTVSAWSTPEPTMPAVRPDLAQPAAPAPVDNAATPQPEPTVSPAQTPAADPSPSDADAADATAAPTPAQPAAKPKRRSGRSAVPSWDEILFGD